MYYILGINGRDVVIITNAETEEEANKISIKLNSEFSHLKIKVVPATQVHHVILDILYSKY